jgi:hypothetical protein
VIGRSLAKRSIISQLGTRHQHYSEEQKIFYTGGPIPRCRDRVPRDGLLDVSLMNPGHMRSTKQLWKSKSPFKASISIKRLRGRSLTLEQLLGRFNARNIGFQLVQRLDATVNRQSRDCIRGWTYYSSYSTLSCTIPPPACK